ncbi:LysR family transcriptional regulator [Vibrio superstes]|uniref:LysR family transcriptional regulator n=1 Tax=Vibrio superstes TaxID=198815 RepID=UPI0022A80C5E|nr:LysR family transcriptional regulator [Vibrio superstes]
MNELDLNLLKVLRTVVETKSLSSAAMLLSISQTSVRRGVVKLKEHFGPQFFVRKPHGIESSELAIKLAQASSEMLTPIEKVLDACLDFEPKNYTGKISILVNTFLLELFGPKLILQLRDSFSNATFSDGQVCIDLKSHFTV